MSMQKAFFLFLPPLYFAYFESFRSFVQVPQNLQKNAVFWPKYLGLSNFSILFC